MRDIACKNSCSLHALLGAESGSIKRTSGAIARCRSQAWRRQSVGFGSIMAAAFDCCDDLLERRVVHGHQVSGFGKTAALHVLGVFLEGRDTLRLKPLVFLAKIPVGFGVAGDAVVVVLEDVIGQKELRVTAAAGTEGHQKQ